MSYVIFDEMPPEPKRMVWQDWLRRHGIDPNDVAVSGWIQRRPGAYQIAYEAYAFDDRGRVVVEKERDEPRRVVRVFQMEGPPLPFPRGIGRAS